MNNKNWCKVIAKRVQFHFRFRASFSLFAHIIPATPNTKIQSPNTIRGVNLANYNWSPISNWLTGQSFLKAVENNR